MSRWPSLRERLFANLIIDPSGCVLWTGACNPNGYGTISANGRQSYVHRVMFEMFEGPIPEDRPQLDHVKDRGCTHKNCANVAHLEPVTNHENNLRAQTLAVTYAARTHCINNHEYTPANTRITPQGSRQCRRCVADTARRIRREKARLRPAIEDRGKFTRGERNGQALLSEASVIEIRTRFAGTLASAPAFAAEVAPAYGVLPPTILNVIRRVSWRHLP